MKKRTKLVISGAVLGLSFLDGYLRHKKIVDKDKKIDKLIDNVHKEMGLSSTIDVSPDGIDIEGSAIYFSDEGVTQTVEEDGKGSSIYTGKLGIDPITGKTVYGLELRAWSDEEASVDGDESNPVYLDGKQVMVDGVSVDGIIHELKADIVMLAQRINILGGKQ